MSKELGRTILEAVKSNLGFTKDCEILGIAKSSLHRFLTGK